MVDGKVNGFRPLRVQLLFLALARHPREGGDPVTSALRRVLLRMVVSKVNGFRLLRMRVTFSCLPKRK
ncbi:hypothetical protein V1318_12985 [Lysobacter sp. CCNWLW3]|uniref:hypothetical protein n=1 Tax=unclassified Lysobacter TaxID=2635362 RepID=UPI002FD5A294